MTPNERRVMELMIECNLTFDQSNLVMKKIFKDWKLTKLQEGNA